MLPESFGKPQPQAPAAAKASADNISAASTHHAPHDIVPLWLVEKNTIQSAIAVCDGNIPLAAAYLGVSASTIYRKMKAW